MSDLARRIAAAFPGVLAPDEVSVLKIHTTQPLVLFFNAGDEVPACAAQLAPTAVVTSIHAVMRRIWLADRGLVAEPLGCLDQAEGRTWGVVRGLSGWPWFGLPARYPGAAGHGTVTEIALASLERFRHAVASFDDWRLRESVSACLERQLRTLELTRADVASSIDPTARERWIAALAAIDPTRWHRQHGDFCLNNLLIEGKVASVVDFEEFGEAGAPLHDEFSLGFSLHEFGERTGVDVDLSTSLRRCVDANPLAAGMDAEVRTALLVHHLCWRLNQCATRPTRAELAVRLVSRLAMVVAGRLRMDAS